MNEKERVPDLESNLPPDLGTLMDREPFPDLFESQTGFPWESASTRELELELKLEIDNERTPAKSPEK